MTTANIVFLIDIQNGFAQEGLSPQQGGSLYVPGGEKVGEPAANLIRTLSGATIILSQDFHPADHISFASNHPGAAPFSNVNLKRGKDGMYHVSESLEGTIPQTLWLDHCIQGTESALFVEEIMGELPSYMYAQLSGHARDAVLLDNDDRKNAVFVIRKGMNADIDSYGIGTENDGVSTTAAPPTFAMIADCLQDAHVKEANIYIGGLATNFCVEFSHNDIYKYLVPELKVRGIKTNVHFLTDISAGIPDDFVPPGFKVSEALERMTAKGTLITTTADVMRSTLEGQMLKARGPALRS
jgi:nicotinamidase/pyrazinamidase